MRPPWTKKSLKVYPAKEAKIIDGGSPTKVAVPSRFDITAKPIIKFAGLSFSFLQRAKAIGAITKTVATFSTKMEMIPVIAKIRTIAIPVLGEYLMIMSATRDGAME